MTIARWPSRLSNLLGIELPIVQGAFGGLRSQRQVAEVSNCGGLGSLGANLLQPAEIAEAIAAVRGLTDKPFAVNLWVSTADDVASADHAAFARAVETLAPLFHSLNAPLPTYKVVTPMSFEAQVRVVLDAEVPVFSFTCGVPPAALMQECRTRGIRTLGTATTPEEASALAEAGVDAVIAAGFEAGGHRGTFLRPAEESLVGTFALVPQIVDAVRVPVVAAGGIADARGVLAALALGADGVQIGTALLAAEAAGASRPHREAISQRRYTPTALSRGFTGRLARGIDNALMRALHAGAATLPYPLQRALVRELTTRAESAGRADLLQMWAGQSAGLGRGEDAATFIGRLVAEVEPVLPSIVAWTSQRTRNLSTGDPPVRGGG